MDRWRGGPRPAARRPKPWLNLKASRCPRPCHGRRPQPSPIGQEEVLVRKLEAAAAAGAAEWPPCHPLAGTHRRYDRPERLDDHEQ
eukprot:8341481-Pyramimonas_sp.AAC.1